VEEIAISVRAVDVDGGVFEPPPTSAPGFLWFLL
jgi:hypothetical protein